jgi:hypothetical protein
MLLRPVTLGLAALTLLAASPAPRRPAVLPFVHDDWPKALAEAKARDFPLFVESWAPW